MFIALLIIAITLTAFSDDRVGVAIVAASPQDVATAGSHIRIQFNAPMNRDNTTVRLRLEPAVPGTFFWEDDATMLFDPATSLQPGQDYHVIFEAGADSMNGRKVLRDYNFTFTVRQPRIVYIAPGANDIDNIWLTDAINPAEARQLTHSETGVINFDVSPDGSQIAYTERSADTLRATIMLLDVESGTVRQLVNCPDSDCQRPAWRPDGRTIAYERVGFNEARNEENGLVEVSRVWMIDLTESPPVTFPLFANADILGRAPRWSPDGRRIAMFDSGRSAIVLYDFAVDDFGAVPSRNAVTGVFSPDGDKLLFPESAFQGSNQASSFLQLADLESRQFLRLSEDNAPYNDGFSVWHPDGETLTVARQYRDERWTAGYQLYTMRIDDLTAEPLLIDPNYALGFFAWDPSGETIVMQRVPVAAQSGTFNRQISPEVWTFHPQSGTLRQLATNAFHPRWLP